MRVAILATDGVEMSKLTEPRVALEEAGAKTTLMAPKAGKIQATTKRPAASTQT
jgi:protease I